MPLQRATPDAASRPIAFCITELDAGGAEQAMVELVTRLDRNRWSPHVACLGPRGILAVELERHSIPVACFGARGAGSISVVWRLAQWLSRVKPVLLQTWLYHANIAGRMAARMAGVAPVVAGIRVAEKRSRWRLRIDRWTNRFVARHVCVSQSVANFSIREGGLPAQRVVVIPNGVDAQRFAHASPADLLPLGISPQAPTVLFVGRLDPQKNPALLVEAAARIIPRRGDVHFVLAGEGPLRESLQQSITEKGLTANVHLTGRRSDVPQLLKASSCLALTSDWEGMPNVVLEAMASGRPVVATDVEGVSEVVSSGVHGLLVPRGSVDSFVGALEQLLDDPDAAERLGIAAQQHVSSCFTWDEMARRYEQLYEELVAAQPHYPS